MEIEVRLFATFRRDRWKNKKILLDNNITIQDVLKYLEIKEEALGIALVNGRHSQSNSVLKDGDVLALFPPIGGG